jgi:hypothetical protein
MASNLTTIGVRFQAVILFCFCAGCGAGASVVQGTVTFAGKPVEEGTIVFEPADGSGASFQGVIEDGRYEVTEGVLLGKKVVRIRGFQRTGRKVEAGLPLPPGTMIDEVRQIIPAQYNDQSDLTIEAVAGQVNHFDFDLDP